MGGAVVWMWYLRLLRDNQRESSNKTAFGIILWMMYLVIGGILVSHGATVGLLPFIPSFITWLVGQLIVLKWSIKFNESFNEPRRLID